MTQSSLFDGPPVHGRTRESRAASRSGARAVVETWTARQSAYLQLLRTAGALCDQEAAALLGWPLSSVNSVRGAVIEKGVRIEPAGADVFRYVDVSGRERVTQRTRWRVIR